MSDVNDIWSRAVDTLASMCAADKMGRGPRKKVFVDILRLYANEMEKCIPDEEKLKIKSQGN